MSFDIDRRMAEFAALSASAIVASSGCASARPQAASAGTVGYPPELLPFDPKTAPGFSAAILTSRHERNYSGAFRQIGEIQTELASTDMTQTPGFKINGLKREELVAIDSMIFHEIHFNWISAGDSRPDATPAGLIEKDFGSE